MFGLTTTSGASASLLLNLEAVLTAVIAWLVFKENADRRIVAGMAAIVAGGVVLSWPNQNTSASDWMGPTPCRSGLSVLGHRQQSDAQGVRFGCHCLLQEVRGLLPVA